MNDMSILNSLRVQIDELDNQILQCLNQRAEVVKKVGEFKEDNKGEVYVPSRELAIYDRLTEISDGPFPKNAISKVFREVISACLSLEAPLKVMYLGPMATFTHAAAMHQFGLSAELIPGKTIDGIFDDVERGLATYGVVPLENSTEGSVHEVLDRLLSTRLHIIAERFIEVSHSLLSNEPDLNQIRVVYSHPQAFSQCRSWVKEHMPDVTFVEISSTAAAAERAANEKGTAAIANKAAGGLYGVSILRESIEDHTGNATRFVVVGNKCQKPSEKDKTSIVFSGKDGPGALYKMLLPFQEQNINLTKIMSRPFRDKPWEYLFFIDFEGHKDQEHIAQSLDEFSNHCQFFKILGSYPVAKGR